MIKRAILGVLFLVKPCLARTEPPRDGGATITGGESAPYYSPAERPDAPVAKPAPAPHRFYDNPAKIELAVGTTAAALDIGQTCHNLATGGHEYWMPTQHCPQISLLVLGGVAAQEGLAYVFHRTGHHKLERLIRLVTIEENTRAIIYSKQHGAW